MAISIDYDSDLATAVNGAVDAGETEMVVKDAVIFSPGATIAYALSGGSIEYNTRAGKC